MNHLEEMCRNHFNEPVLLGFDVGRLVGYAEDEMDCYLIINYPHPKGTVYHTCVGGYTFLDRLKGQKPVISSTGETWDDYYRIDNLLELNGAPKVSEFTSLSRSTTAEEGILAKDIGGKTLICDGNCGKAWGINNRPTLELSTTDPDDYAFLADSELGDAPENPGTYEGGHGKPHRGDGPNRQNKWCYRECERSISVPAVDTNDLRKGIPDFSQRVFNIPSLHG